MAKSDSSSEALVRPKWRTTDGLGRSHDIDEVDRGGGRVINPIARRPGMPLGGGGVAAEFEMKPATTIGMGRCAIERSRPKQPASDGVGPRQLASTT